MGITDLAGERRKERIFIPPSSSWLESAKLPPACLIAVKYGRRSCLRYDDGRSLIPPGIKLGENTRLTGALTSSLSEAGERSGQRSWN